MKFNTKAIHAGQKPEETSGAVMPPIFQTSTYAQETPGVHKGHEYARVSNPTRSALERLVAGLENADECACFSSGCAAMDAVIKMFRPGDHIIASDDLYGGTYRLFTNVFQPFGIDFTFVNMTDTENVISAAMDTTKLLWIETPTNPLLRVVDISEMTDFAKANNILTVVDNTFASPYLQKPLDLGADVVLHSMTKYLGGHSDIIGGAVATSNPEVMEKLRFQVKTTGAVPGPMDCYLTLRGIKTLHVRVQRAVENAKKVAEFLAGCPDTGEVIYPGLTSHPQHEIAKKQMNDFGAMVSFTLGKGGADGARKFTSRTKIFTLAESLGGVESLICHPVSMTHASIPKEVREAAGLKDSLIRLSVGIEDSEDLVEDLEQAFG